jgi:arylsulfatase A-like enzyme
MHLPAKYFVYLCVLAAFCLAGQVWAGDATQARPNFVVVMAEAQGWSSLSTPMDDRIPNSKSEVNLTVNLDRLAKEGMRFSDAYSASPRCTPSRASFFTGKSPAQLHMTFVNDRRGDRSAAGQAARKVLEPRCIVELPSSEITIANLLKREEYATAHFGKWHVGRESPSAHGFEESDGPTNNEGLTNNPGESNRMADRGADFMARQTKAGKPFYLQVSHYPVRGSGDVMAATMIAVKQRLSGKLAGRAGQEQRRLAEVAANQDMDESIGKLLNKIDDLGIAANTYVIFTSDHGSQGRNANAPLYAGKGTVWEGGIRVPLVIRGPGIAAGRDSHVRTIAVDLFPTIAELANITAPLPSGIEGGSLVPVLKNAGTGEIKRSREELVFHFPHYDSDEYGPASAIILGQYKLIRYYASGAEVLFDLEKDIGEEHDLAKQLPDTVKQLDDRLTAYLSAVGAQLPTPNPDFDPTKVKELLRSR